MPENKALREEMALMERQESKAKGASLVCKAKPDHAESKGYLAQLGHRDLRAIAEILALKVPWAPQGSKAFKEQLGNAENKVSPEQRDHKD
jgi:hypothetical protein